MSGRKKDLANDQKMNRASKIKIFPNGVARGRKGGNPHETEKNVVENGVLSEGSILVTNFPKSKK